MVKISIVKLKLKEKRKKKTTFNDVFLLYTYLKLF